MNIQILNALCVLDKVRSWHDVLLYLSSSAAAAAKFRRESLFCPDELDSLFSYFDTGSGPRSKFLIRLYLLKNHETSASIPNISCRFNFESCYKNIGLHICLLQTRFLMYCVRSQALNDWEGHCVSNVSLAWHPLAPQVSAVIAGLAAVLTAAQTYSFSARWWTASPRKVRWCPTLVYLSVVFIPFIISPCLFVAECEDSDESSGEVDIEQEASDPEDGRELDPNALLHKASRTRNLRVMAEALAHGADVNSVSGEDQSKSPLIQAVAGVRLNKSKYTLK